MKTDWTTDVKGSGQYAEVNGIKLYYETYGAGHPTDPAAWWAWVGRDVRACSSTVYGAPPGRHRRSARTWPYCRHRSTDRSPADGRRHRGTDRAPGTGQARPCRLLARWWCCAADGGKVPGEGPSAGGRLSKHPARRDLSGDAGAAEPGERGRHRVHERHADVPALPTGRATPRGLPSVTDQDRGIDVEGLRLH